ncbi:hypothetical protein BJF83_12430 [Nocardiopsis sp. CNR-923]|uniref:helix-turn-helix domain-containing protein n=1 Tax=Nocardiopsis sp. CNR-923 TaxID=1904965 RepID=UPI0009613414|nr:Scr1 family TA system antitoxin-like transcriptional regulator [Nocardiopsis sp. CNR-923]OLT29242.1 hypothetical protein BJF83_12430 [Nocardiopsis sp. CNR-923]
MSPTPFSDELTRCRESLGLSQTQLATRSGLSLSSVNRWERGGSLPKRETVERLDAVLNADGALLARYQEAKDGFTVPPWARDLAWIEAKARTVEVVAPVLVPGYLQSPTYAEMLFRAAQPWLTSDEIRKLVSLRCQRLEQLPNLRVTAVFPVSALTAVPEEVRREQVATLRGHVAGGRVDLHLVPAGSVLLTPTAPVMVFRFGNGELTASCDYATGSVIADVTELRKLTAMTTTALASALPVALSLDTLEGLA